MPTAQLKQALHNSAAPASLPVLACPPERPHALAGTRARGRHDCEMSRPLSPPSNDSDY